MTGKVRSALAASMGSLLLALASCGSPSPSPSASPQPAPFANSRCWAYTQSGSTVATVASRANALRSSPCGGISWVFHWSDLEPAPGHFTWNLVDAAIADSAAVGRKVFLRVLAGINSPVWVNGAVRAVAVPATKNTPSGTIPAPWDPRFLSDWSSFISAYGHRYDGNPHIALIETAGTGIYGESYLPGGVSIWQAAGYTESTYISAIEQIVMQYVTAFPHTPIALDVSNGVVGSGQNVMAPLVSWVRSDLPARVYVQQNGLSGTTKPGRMAVQRAHLFGLQMVGPSSQSRTGNLCDAFNTALEVHAEYVEVYYQDASNPAEYPAMRYLMNGDISASCSS